MPGLFNAKRLFSYGVFYSGFASLSRLLLKKTRMPFLLGLNYHWTPQETSDSLEKQLIFFSKHFEIIDRPMLDAFFSGASTLKKPGLLLCFDDGAINNYEVAAPLLEKYGMRGWFFAVAGARDETLPNEIGGACRSLMLSFDKLKDLKKRGHEIGCHSYSHCNIGQLPEDRLHLELVESKRILEEQIEAPVDSFCYPLGTDDAYSVKSLEVLRKHYQYVFHSAASLITLASSPYDMGRLNVDASMPVPMVSVITSGVWNLRNIKRSQKYQGLLANVHQSDVG